MEEDEPHGNKTDRCISGLMYKTSGGLLVGAIFSLVLFKKRTWPMFIGSGIGTGVATSHCVHMFQHEIDDAKAEFVGEGLGCDLPEMFAKTKAALGKT